MNGLEAEMVRSCKGCDFWVAFSDGSIGLCVKRAPTPAVATSQDTPAAVGVWPATLPQLGCGEWQVRTEYEDRPSLAALTSPRMPPGMLRQ